MWYGVKRAIFWDFARASWQYDILIAAILAFVFLTPREWFHDQPRIPQAHELVLLPGPHGSSVFWLDQNLFQHAPAADVESARITLASEIIQKKTGKPVNITRVDPVYDSEHEITGYMAVAKP